MTYPFNLSHKFIEELKHSDMVIGIRKPKKGAMPILHRYLGNPGLSFLTRLFFGTPVRDAHCGMRGIKKEVYEQLKMKYLGMEFAPEMVIKVSLLGFKISQFPISYYKRPGSPSKLSTVKDGFRHLKYLFVSLYNYRLKKEL